MSALTLRGGRVIDPATGLDAVADVRVENGRIAAVGPSLPSDGTVRDVSGLVVTPGFVDLHTHLREPGEEHKETVESGTLAAARGGFTTVCAMPNTLPPVDSRAVVDLIHRQAQGAAARVLVIGCITTGRKGKTLAEMAELAEAGCVGFSDDGDGVADGNLMRRALEYARGLDLPIIQHPEDPVLVAGGVMHEGWVATRLGLRGRPAAAEEAMAARDIQLVELTGGRLHLTHVTSAGTVALVRAAKARGLPVTADVTPHHLTLTHEAILHTPGVEGLAYDTNAKVNPPLRTPDDQRTCVQALRDGTIDAIATDHAPHAVTDKLCEFDQAKPGISALETALGLGLRLVEAGDLSLPDLIARLTVGPVKTLNLDRRPGLAGLGTLTAGAPADIAVFDPRATWTVTPETLVSKGKNTPLLGQTLQGQVVMTLLGGEVKER